MIENYYQEILKIIQLALPLFLSGLALQRGTILYVGPSADYYIKISTANQEAFSVLGKYEKKKTRKMKLSDLAFLKQLLSDHPFTFKKEVIL